MILFFQSLNNREIALLFWLSVIATFLFKIVGKSLLSFLKSLFAYKLVIAYTCIILYFLLSVFLLKKINFWNITFLKDTIFWFFGASFIISLNATKAKNINYFKKIILDAVKLSVFLEFITNLYSFNLATELIIMPFMTFLILLKAYADTDKKHIEVSKVLGNVASVIGFAIFFYSIYKTITNYKESLSIYNLKSFLLPVFFTILFIPLAYSMALFSNYEELFLRLSFKTKNKRILKKVKLKILKTANLNLIKVTQIASNINGIDIEDILNLDYKFK